MMTAALWMERQMVEHGTVSQEVRPMADSGGYFKLEFSLWKLIPSDWNITALVPQQHQIERFNCLIVSVQSKNNLLKY